MEPYLNDNDFNRYFKYLQIMSVFSSSSRKWTDHPARVSHIDIYNIAINKGDTYYKRTLGNKELKLSHQSMDKYLYLLFEETPELQERCENLLEEQKKQIAKGKSLRVW